MDRAEANGLTFARLCAADPVLVDIRPAINALPGMTPILLIKVRSVDTCSLM